jgi:hypothetical protein
VPAVFERPQSLHPERARPREQRLGGDGACPLGEWDAERVDDDGRERVLVHVQANNDHGDRLRSVGGDRRADRPQSRQQPRSYQVTLDGLGTAAATQRWTVSPRATFGIESAAAARVCASYRTLPPGEDDIEFRNVP